jgi:ribonuclease HI
MLMLSSAARFPVNISATSHAVNLSRAVSHAVNISRVTTHAGKHSNKKAPQISPVQVQKQMDGISKEEILENSSQIFTNLFFNAY